MLQILRSVRRLCEKVIRGRLQEQPMNCNFAPISMEQIISIPMCHIFLESLGHALLNCCSLLKTLKLAVWTLSLICLHVFTLFVIDIHQIMLIPLFPTPLGFWLLPNRILNSSWHCVISLVMYICISSQLLLKQYICELLYWVSTMSIGLLRPPGNQADMYINTSS